MPGWIKAGDRERLWVVWRNFSKMTTWIYAGDEEDFWIFGAIFLNNKGFLQMDFLECTTPKGLLR